MNEEQKFEVLAGEEFAEAYKHACPICGAELTIDNSVFGIIGTNFTRDKLKF